MSKETGGPETASEKGPLTLRRSLDDLLLETIDDVLRQALGEEAVKIIYKYIENISHLEREEIAEKPEVFPTELKRLLGSGALLIERLILKNLYSRLQLEFKEKKDYEFSDYIKELRKGKYL